MLFFEGEPGVAGGASVAVYLELFLFYFVGFYETFFVVPVEAAVAGYHFTSLTGVLTETPYYVGSVFYAFYVGLTAFGSLESGGGLDCFYG